MPETTSSSAAFIDAIKAGEFERVKAMVSADPTLIDARSRTGDSAILTAVYHRQKEIVNLLVARGASLSIFEACAAGEIERVERLLQRARAAGRARRQQLQRRRLDAAAPRGVLRPRQDRRAADRARRRRRSRARATPTATRRCTPRSPATTSSSPALLIGHGADVNAADAQGWRPLHLAAANNNMDAIKQLIAQGADVHAANGEAKTALSLATEKNHREAAALLAHGA